MRGTYTGSHAAAHIFKLKCLPFEKNLIFKIFSPDTDLDEFPLKITYKQVLKKSEGDFSLFLMQEGGEKTPGLLLFSMGQGAWAGHLPHRQPGLGVITTGTCTAFPALSAVHKASMKNKQKPRNRTPTINRISPPKPDKANSTL